VSWRTPDSLAVISRFPGSPCLLVPKLRLGTQAEKLRFRSATRAIALLLTRSRASRLACPSGAWEREWLENVENS
jgi:hypothetical protein